MQPNDLDQHLQAALLREKLVKPADAPEGDPSGMNGLGYGMRLATEFMAGTLVGMGIGYGIDRLFDSTPWGILLFTLFGFGAGVMNMYRLMNQMDDTIGLNRKALKPAPQTASGLTKPGQTGKSEAGENPSD